VPVWTSACMQFPATVGQFNHGRLNAAFRRGITAAVRTAEFWCYCNALRLATTAS
jgi:hypothetical protein